MPVYVRDPADSTWKRANNPTSRLLHVREADVWRAVANVWLRDADTWKPLTDYQGMPGATTGLRVTSAINNYSGVSFDWQAPTTGAPVSKYHVILLQQNGTPWPGWPAEGFTVGNVLSWSTGIAADSVFQIKVVAYSAAGVTGPESNTVRYAIGHPQQTVQTPLEGWGPPFDDTGTQVDNFRGLTGLSTEQAGFPATNVADFNGSNHATAFATTWRSAPRTISYGFEGVRVIPTQVYRRVYAVKVWPQPGRPHRMWLGMFQANQWWPAVYSPTGGGWPAQPNYWLGGFGRTHMAHQYFWESGTQDIFANFIIPPLYNFYADQCLVDIAVDQLFNFGGANNWRAELQEIIIEVQDWTYNGGGYRTDITVNEQNCYYW